MNTNTIVLINEFNSTYLPLIDLGLKGIGLTSLIFIWYQIRQARLWNKLRSEFNFINLSQDAEFEKALHQALLALDISPVGKTTPLDSGELNKIVNNGDARLALKMFLNYYENICAAINIGHADEDLASGVHSSRVRRTFTLFEPFIKNYRDLYNDQHLYRELEKTYRRWNNVEMKRQRKIQE